MGLGRQLWGAAISISPDGNYGRDPSHPAFYLPGQQFGGGNHRAFAALDACVDERRLGTADCCPADPGKPGNTCIAGFCAYIPPPE